VFVAAGKSDLISSGRLGAPTTTSYKGQPGSGITWIADNAAGLRAFKSVPVNGKLIELPIPPTGGCNKFARPAFGDGKVYITNSQGTLICMGSPVSLPLTCTNPVDFGSVSLGTTKSLQVSCTANIAITSFAGIKLGDASFVASASDLPKSLTAGQNFTFPVLWDLRNTTITQDANASFSNEQPGIKSSSLILYTNNAVAKYSTQYPITLQGYTVSADPFLVVSPSAIDFGGIVLGSPDADTGVQVSFTITNVGDSDLIIKDYGYSDDPESGTFTKPDYIPGTKDTVPAGVGFNVTGIPVRGTVLKSGKSITATAQFLATKGGGNYQSVFKVWSNGGSQSTLFTGSASKVPIAKLEVSKEGGWTELEQVEFGNVVSGNKSIIQIRICNSGGSGLLITKSKVTN